jgi:acyl-CoA synthetase (AMP-forming)/AMP-acid ligase II
LKSCGIPLPLVQFKVVDKAGVEVTANKVGELWVRTPMALKGYWNRQDATDEAYKDGWYHTGDLGFRDDAGFITLVDRAKDMIISGGENVYSTEVEQVLARHEDIMACAVVGLPDAKWGERVVAAVVARPGTALTQEEIIQYCRAVIAGYKTPKQVFFFDELPLTPTGKVKKSVLKNMLIAEIS